MVREELDCWIIAWAESLTALQMSSLDCVEVKVAAGGGAFMRAVNMLVKRLWQNWCLEEASANISALAASSTIAQTSAAEFDIGAGLLGGPGSVGALRRCTMMKDDWSCRWIVEGDVETCGLQRDESQDNIAEGSPEDC